MFEVNYKDHKSCHVSLEAAIEAASKLLNGGSTSVGIAKDGKFLGYLDWDFLDKENPSNTDVQGYLFYIPFAS